MTKLLFISATNGNNLKLANLLIELAKEGGAETELVQLEDLDLPLFTPSQNEKGVPEIAAKLTQKVINSDALILLSPEYNGSIPPVVTNAIAWMSTTGDDFREAFNGKFAVVGTHSGGGGFKVIEAQRSMLNHLGMIVLARTFTTNYSKEQNLDSAKAIFSQLNELIT